MNFSQIRYAAPRGRGPFPLFYFFPSFFTSSKARRKKSRLETTGSLCLVSAISHPHVLRSRSAPATEHHGADTRRPKLAAWKESTNESGTEGVGARRRVRGGERAGTATTGPPGASAVISRSATCRHCGVSLARDSFSRDRFAARDRRSVIFNCATV